MRSILLLLVSVVAAASSFGQVAGERPLSSPVYGPVDRFFTSSIAPDPIYGGVERVFVNVPHAIRARAAGSNP
jgi:hypothetical protein